MEEKEKYNEKLLNEKIIRERNNSNIVEDYKKGIEKYQKQIFDIVSKPQIVQKNTTNNTLQVQIEKLGILTESSISSCLHQLTMDHINNGPKGYAKLALDFPFENRIICTDSSRQMIKYKDENERLQTDPGGMQISKTFFKVVVPKSVELLMSEGTKIDQDERLDVQQRQDRRVELLLMINHIRNIARGDVEGEAYREEWSKYVAKGSVASK